MILQVTVEITAVEFRRLNSFEWAVLTMLNTFQGDTPPIAEAASQLSIGEPAFLFAALENLRLVGAVKPKSDELGQKELKDFELTELGVKTLREEGWEDGHAQAFSEAIPFEWPSLRIRPHRREEHHREPKQHAPPLDEVQSKLTPEILEVWLNQNHNSQCWLVKNFFVANVEN